jgi:hypothetical protein
VAERDVQLIRSHLHYKGNVFVTSDDYIHKPGTKVHLIAVGADRIEHSADALALVETPFPTERSMSRPAHPVLLGASRSLDLPSH